MDQSAQPFLSQDEWDDLIAAFSGTPWQPQVHPHLAQQPAGSGGPSEIPDWQLNPEIGISEWTVLEKIESPGFVVLDSVQTEHSRSAFVKYNCHVRDAIRRPHGIFAQSCCLIRGGHEAEASLQNAIPYAEQVIFHLQFRECTLLQEHFAIIRRDLEGFVAQVRRLVFWSSQCKMWVLMTDVNDRVAKNPMAADPMPPYPMALLQEGCEEDVSVVVGRIWNYKGSLVYVGRSKMLN
ncbi:uncharacterized protein RHO25_008186 [Cercospora beticola]|uniref:Uncharacterized protein n=1 Tax=Cercospora beticola TaxID=122368 RepID=A0ABZ0NVN0_CERBT|nr:hypothetical protein RHO25_008186 [Cercospora beticola]